MKKITIILASIALLVAGCARELVSPVEAPEGESVFTLNLSLPPDDAKTYVSQPDEDGIRTITWKAGDCVSLNGAASNPLAEEYDGQTGAQFEFNAVVSTPYKVLYPASMYVDETHVNLPAVQDAMPEDPDEGDFASGAVPLAGYAESSASSLSMKHLCAAVKIQWKQSSGQDPDTDDIMYVEFRGGDGEQVSGNFGIDYAAGTLSQGSDVTAASRTVRVLSGKPVGEDVSYANVVIPAGTYSNGFTIRLVDENGHFMEKTVTASKTFAPGEVVRYPVLEFEPTGTVLIIDTQEKFVNWMEGTENKDASANIILGADIDMTGVENWTAVDFAGVFDGMGHSVTNFRVTSESATGACYFKTVTGKIMNVTFGSAEDASAIISTASSSPKVAPVNTLSGSEALLENITSHVDVTFNGSVTSGALYISGLVASHSGGLISRCTNSGAITVAGNQTATNQAINIGGLSSSVGACTISKCTNSGTIDVKGEYTHSINEGGITGYSDAAANVISCVNNGSVLFSAGSPTSTTGQLSIGGIIGYLNSTTAVCSVTDCVNAGTVWKAAANEEKGSYIGGIAGYVKSPAAISGCTNAVDAVVKNTGSCSSKQMYMGGIAGYATLASTFYSCENAGTVSNSKASTNIMLGGIVGRSTGAAQIGAAGKGCVNSGTVSNTGSSSNASANVLPNINVGGIAGCCAATSVTSCSNTGSIQNTGAISSNMKARGNIIAVSGIVATLNGAGSIVNCTSSGSVSNTAKSYAARNCTAGILGYNYSAAAADFSGNTSSATITVSGTHAFENNAGGVIGYVNAVNTAITGCSFSGTLTNSLAREKADTLSDRTTPPAVCLGGVVGKHTGTAVITNCSNENTVTSTSQPYYVGINIGGIAGNLSGAETSITSCTNGGLIREAFTPTLELMSCIGGIIGKTECKTSLNGNSNNGEVSRHNGSTSKSSKFYLGGIVGYNTVEGTSIDDCHNTGYIHSWAATQGNSYVGGILGVTNKKVSVTDCDNSGNVAVDSQTTTCYFAGIVGTYSNGAAGATLSGCENTGKVSCTGKVKNLRMSGVIADAYGSYTFTDCTNRGEVSYNAAPLSTNDIRVAGFEASNTSSKVTLVRCRNFGNVSGNFTATVATGYFGGLLAYNSAGCTITDCENYGDVTMTGTFTTKAIRVASICGYTGNESTVISGCRSYCSVLENSTDDVTAYTGQLVGYGKSTTIKTSGVGGSVNGVAVNSSNWKTKGILYGNVATTTANINVSGDSDSCYFIDSAPEIDVD